MPSIKQSTPFSSVLSSAVLEWILMLLLFLDAMFSYLVTKFSRLSKLQTPCLLCSRLDHFLGNEKPGFYWNLICDVHKSEISSLAFCHVHGKLANVHSMCEVCLLSFATEKKSNPETYRSLVGKLGVDFGDHGSANRLDEKSSGIHECRGDDVACAPLLKMDKESPVMKTCSCCSALFESKPHGFRLIEETSIRDDVVELPISYLNRSRQNHQLVEDDTSKLRRSSFSPAASSHLRNRDLDQFTHIDYSEVKVNSDSESEPLSEDDGITTAHETTNTKQDFFCQCPESDPIITVQKSSSANLLDELEQERLIHPGVVPTVEIPEKQHFVSEAREFAALSSSNDAGHVLEELDGNNVEIKLNTEEPKIVPQGVQYSAEESDAKESIVAKATVTADATAAPDSKNVPCSLEVNPKREQMDLNDAYNLAVGAGGSLPSPTFAEVIKGKDSAKIQDFKLFISQFSAARGLESPWPEMSPSPRALEQGEESVLQNITKTLSLERNESGMESFDGNLVSEMEGESTVDRLKRQIDLDKKSIGILYKELEEERSASAIAANQAMAMITKLQEEKAAMQMEALQYQRMMEEQTEYDQDALQHFQDIFAQKDKEIQDLEEELDSFRKRFTNESSVNEASEQVVEEAKSVKKFDQSDMASQVSKWTGKDGLADPLLCLDDEKAYISDCLVKLEKKLHHFSKYGTYLDGSTFASNEGEHVNAYGDDFVQSDGICQKSSGEDCVRLTTVLDDDSAINGSCSAEISSVSVQDAHRQTNSLLGVEEKENTPENHEGIVRDTLKVGNPPALTALIKEVSQLSQRLEALEADRNFLEHVMNSLRNGNDGIEFVRDIASDLRELRQIGIPRQENFRT